MMYFIDLKTRKLISEREGIRQFFDQFPTLNPRIVKAVVGVMHRLLLVELKQMDNQIGDAIKDPKVHLRFYNAVLKLMERLQNPACPVPEDCSDYLRDHYDALRDLLSGQEQQVSAYLNRTFRSDLVGECSTQASKIAELTTYVLKLKKMAIEKHMEKDVKCITAVWNAEFYPEPIEARESKVKILTPRGSAES